MIGMVKSLRYHIRHIGTILCRLHWESQRIQASRKDYMETDFAVDQSQIKMSLADFLH